MTFDIRYTGVANWQTVCVRDRAKSQLADDGTTLLSKEIQPITSIIGFAMMNTGIGWELTPKNLPEFYARVRWLEAIYGPMVNESDKQTGRWFQRSLFLHEITAHVGLRVNVAPETRAAFLRRHNQGFFRDRIGDFERESKLLEAR